MIITGLFTLLTMFTLVSALMVCLFAIFINRRMNSVPFWLTHRQTDVILFQNTSVDNSMANLNDQKLTTAIVNSSKHIFTRLTVT